MDIKELLAYCDHTLLRVDCTEAEIRKLCDQAIKYGCASVCIPPCHVPGAKRYVGDKMKICTVIGFPNGYMSTAAKAFEAADAVANGADEIDMVINLSMVKDGCWDDVAEDIKAVRRSCLGKVLKVIIECCLLTDEEKMRMCTIVSECGADFIKTSTGKVDVNATPMAAYVMCECIRKYHEATGRKVGFKAAGGISTVMDAVCYYSIVSTVLGKEWVCRELFRFGVSRLANSLISAVEQKTVSFF